MTITIPLATVPSQTLTVTLGGQLCQISIYQKTTGVFLDMTANNVSIATAALCLDRVKIIRRPYRGFSGDLAFIDTQGVSDPDYTGFGDRFVLAYLP